MHANREYLHQGTAGLAILVMALALIVHTGAAQAKSPASTALVYDVRVSIDISVTSTGGPTGPQHKTVHGSGQTHIRQPGGSFGPCTVDAFTIVYVRNGQPMPKHFPAMPCATKTSTMVFGGINVESLQTARRGTWTVRTTSSVAQSLQVPVYAALGKLLRPVSWTNTYTSDGTSWYSSRGTGTLTQDARLANGSSLHVHFGGSSDMDSRIARHGGNEALGSMSLHQTGALTLNVSNPTTGAAVHEVDTATVAVNMVLITPL